MSILTVTEPARKHIISMLERAGVTAVELVLEPQGCNGYKYVWNPVSTISGDNVLDLGEEYSLVVSRKALPYVIGSEVVMETVGFGQRLSLVNPNAAGSCGCGESVNFK